jgi:hypothetical protein
MRLKGILDFSLGNFLCLRGFAPMSVLQDVSMPDESIQRVPKDERLKEIGDYLKKGEFLFFPEVVLCVNLHDQDDETVDVASFYTSVQQGKAFRGVKFAHGLRVATSVSKSSKSGDIRAVQFFQTCTIDFTPKKELIFSRIDGNHRLAATQKTDTAVRDRTTPFCIVFCRNGPEFRQFSRALFHNINYKQVPLPKEHNLRLILDDPDLFEDEKLKDDPSFGWPYYLARQLHNKLDLDLLANLKPFIEKEPRSFLVDQFTFLLVEKVLGDNENALKRFKEALGRVNVFFDKYPALKDSTNQGLLAVFVYYELKSSATTASFVQWVLDNHLHAIKESNSTDLIKIFDKVLESRKRTIFVSMAFNKPATENHYQIIERVCKEVSEHYDLKPALKVQRVDWFHDGTSYNINDKIVEMMSDFGLLIGNLTYCNPNVYHEIGFVMGRAKGEGKESSNMLLFLDDSIANEKDKFVGFNLRAVKQLRFNKTEEFAKLLRTNLERFFHLTT